MGMRIARFGAALAALATLAGCTLWGEHKPTAWTDITGGESLERVFWLEVKARNWAGVESHVSTNYVLVTPEERLDSAEAIQYWKQLQIQDYSLADFNVQPNGNSYIVSYTLILRGKLANQPLSERPLRAMTVWQHLSRGWFAIAHSATPVATSENK